MSTNSSQSWYLDGALHDSLFLQMLEKEETGPISISSGMHGGLS